MGASAMEDATGGGKGNLLGYSPIGRACDPRLGRRRRLLLVNNRSRTNFIQIHNRGGIWRLIWIVAKRPG